MEKYFKKFTSSANLKYKDLDMFSGANSFNFISGESAIVYNKISNPILLAKHVFPKKIFEIEPHLIYYAQVSGPGNLLPHRDHGITTVANFYFSSNQCVTTFYEKKNGNVNSIKYADALNVADSNIYPIESLNPMASFVAEDGDCYLLNVTEIHGVYSPNPGVRKFINMQWNNKSIDEIYDSLVR